METSSIEATEDVMAAVKVPLTRVRKAVAKAMTFSATVPQFAVERAIQTQAMFDLRKDLPTTISVGDLINAAIVRALVEHPRLNASWHDDHIIEFGHVNLGDYGSVSRTHQGNLSGDHLLLDGVSTAA